MKTGIILVTIGGIHVMVHKDMSHTTCGYSDASVDSLKDAARVLGQWMDLPGRPVTPPPPPPPPPPDPKCHIKELSAEPGNITKQKEGLYSRCPGCNGKPISCRVCKSQGYLPIGITIAQLDHLAEMETLRMEAGVTAAMLRDGRLQHMVDLFPLVHKMRECQKRLDHARSITKVAADEAAVHVDRLIHEIITKRNQVDQPAAAEASSESRTSDSES